MTTRHDIAIALRRAYLALHRRTDAKFEQFGITADQFVLLATLARGDALTQRELAQRMSSDPSTVRAMLVLLEKRGLVERETHPTDSRARTVALTAAGRRAFGQLWEAGEPIREQMQSVLSPQEGQQLLELLSRLAEVLTSEREPAGVSNGLFSPEDSP
jgi:DNA-binding MarR family transcriptional regulator